MAVVLGRNVDRSHYDFQHQIRIIKVPTHPSTIRLIAYWQECLRRGGMLMGRDVPSRAIASLLQDITVAEPVDGWTDARMRLAGSGMSAHFGREVLRQEMTVVPLRSPDDSARWSLTGTFNF